MAQIKQILGQKPKGGLFTTIFNSNMAHLGFCLFLPADDRSGEGRGERMTEVGETEWAKEQTHFKFTHMQNRLMAHKELLINSKLNLQRHKIHDALAKAMERLAQYYISKNNICLIHSQTISQESWVIDLNI